ncbi:hypothetical protein [Cellulomonas sp. Leaf395]|uniref:ApeA N-terminal domain 1-containing protein n=1 Tax=Cellulomonas sp. Leaf395 TaxID=1736362 RepID=UPI0012FA989B|nr:hypothetical protein [Cellulomonas sp. Leaf395]
MALMDTGDLHPARWSRPDEAHDETAVPGTYLVDDEGRVEAHLHATRNGYGPVGFGPPRELPPVLHGESFREHLTLVGARVVASRGGTSDMCDVTIRPDYALEGFAFLDQDELAFTEVRVRFTDQDVWTGWNRFAVKYQHGALTDIGVELRFVPRIEADVDQGVLRLVDASYVTYDPHERRWAFQVRSMFEFAFARPVAINDVFDRYVYPLQVALLSASGRMPGVASMAGTSNAWEFGPGAEQMPTKWFQVRRFHGPLKTPASTDLKYLHRLSDLQFDVHMPKLLRAVDVHRFALSHYSLLHAERAAGGNLARFGVATQLIEAFDRTLHPHDVGDMALEKRLKRLEDESGNLVDEIIGNRKWRTEIAALRNFALHGDVHAIEVLRDQRPLVAASEALLLLFEVRFLVAVGLAATQAKELAVGRVHHWTIAAAITENYAALSAVAERTRVRKRGKRASRSSI